MRDLVVREALVTMARDAGKRLHELVAEGEEIPYEVLEPGEVSALAQYTPQTARFVRDHADALRELDSFGAACASLESAELAAPYLERHGVATPSEPRARAELAGVFFLAKLWAESTDFSIEEDRLGKAIDELQATLEPEDDEIEVVVQLRGLQMPLERLELATASIVRADVVDVPAEARAPEGSGTAGWQPIFLAVARISSNGGDEASADAGARAVEAFRQLVTTLRLFKPGGVGLGSHAWVCGRRDRWRRIATGEGRPRPGGYVLAEDELADLVSLSRALAHRSTPFGRPVQGRPGLAGALARAISRFEAGLERHAVLEALNDYLLTLRFVLEGGGPADLGLPVRVAALCAEPAERGAVKAVVDRAQALERQLWTGEPAPPDDEVGSPVEVAARIEELVRAILKDAACGHLGTDLRATADEILLADGLAVGDGATPEDRGETAEWSPEDEEIWDDEAPAEEGEPWESEWAAADELEEADEARDEPWFGDDDESEPFEEPVGPRAARVQVPEPEGRITLEHRQPVSEEEVIVQVSPAQAQDSNEPEAYEEPTQVIHVAPNPSERVAELIEQRHTERQANADRVAFLFPRPETTEWSVREITYDRRRRANVEAS